jgi:hypothetical protein
MFQKRTQSGGVSEHAEERKRVIFLSIPHAKTQIRRIHPTLSPGKDTQKAQQRKAQAESGQSTLHLSQ